MIHSKQRYHKIEEATSNHKTLYIKILRSMWTWRKKLGEKKKFSSTGRYVVYRVKLVACPPTL